MHKQALQGKAGDAPPKPKSVSGPAGMDVDTRLRVSIATLEAKRKYDSSEMASIQYVPLTQHDKIKLANHIKEVIDHFQGMYKSIN